MTLVRTSVSVIFRQKLDFFRQIAQIFVQALGFFLIYQQAKMM